MRVLISDGNERAALAATRALGQRQIQVVVGAERSKSLAASSKYCSGSFSYPSPYVDPTGFVARILEIVKRDPFTALFPMSDIAMQILGPEKEEFEKYTRVPVPHWSVFEAISDKWNLMKLASSLQVPIPETIFVPAGDIEGVLGGISSFPVVVKPGRSLIQRTGTWCKTSVHYANDAEELQQLYRQIEYLRQPSLVQRRVVGEGQGLFALMNRGEPLVLFAHKRLREKPPSGGVSVLRESVELPKDMVDYALRLLQHVGWHGVAMIEFKIDRDRGVPLLMEANGRFWGSLQLAIDAGVDFPYLLYQLATGQPIQVPINGYPSGVKSRWLLGDLDHLLLRLFNPEGRLHLPPGVPSKWQTLVEFCRFFQRRTYYEVERFNDLGPGIYEWRHYFELLLKGGLH